MLRSGMGRGELEEICDRYLSRREEQQKVTEAVERCLRKGYDYDKMKDRVLEAISDSHRAHKVISAICIAYPQFRKRTKFEENTTDSKRSKKERGRSRSRERSRKDKERGKDADRDNRDKDRRRRDDEVNKKEIEKVGTEAKELMYKAQQEIEERKRQLGLAAAAQTLTGVTAQPAPTAKNVALRPQEAQMFIQASMNKKNRVDELKAKLAKATSTINSLVRPNAPVMAPLPDIPPGILKEREEEYREVPPFVSFRRKNSSSLWIRGSVRALQREKKKMFNFHEKGEFEQLANKQRAVAKLERLQAEISQAAKSTGISSAVKLAMITPAGKSSDDVPDIEWWDSIVLESDSYDAIPDTSVETRFKDTISELVEHPIKLKPPTDPMTPQYLKVYLTSKERKKIRRQNRKEMQKERTEMIRIGLAKAPAPKVKISNLMRVLGSDAVQDPTKMEAHVRKQMADRLKKHQQANAERKLTDEQKAAKKTKKIAEDTSLAVHVAVYRVKSLLHPAKKFKVEMNAKQLQMTGVILLHKNINLVVVEGGPKQQKFYKNLMLNRIKWEDEVIGQKKDADKDAPGERNSCQLIWEGQVKRRNFRDFSVVTATIEKQARDLLEKHNVAHYWDVAYSTTMENVVEKLKTDVEILEKRVKAKEAILKGVFSSLEDASADRRMIREVLSVTPKAPPSPTHVSLEQSWCVGFEDTVCVSFTATNTSEVNNM
ncbi:pre-mRNA processing factor 3 [Ancylostoma ceylanicum]|uniref:Pre-mRNA processing factor 3 n=2 Tax=Ancylostoma ceylanicum TaxID=53326 RepID=A0A0D6LIF8_9BILA|nr:pre-mRNA processing factor 3 [Ancylostoma ceylanicum]